MDERVSFFQLDDAVSAAAGADVAKPAPRAQATPISKRPAAAMRGGPVGRVQGALAVALEEDAEF